MSTASSYPTVVPAPERVPPEVSGTLTAVWLSVGCGLVALAALWPMMLGAAPAVFPDVDKTNLANLGWMTLAGLLGFILVAGLFLSYQVRRKSRTALRLLRLSMLGGMIGGLALIIGMVVVIFQAKGEAPLGPAPIISGMALFLAGLLPFGFAIFALSYAGTDAVEAFFRPAAAPMEESYSGLGGAAVAHAPADAGVVTEPAPEEPRRAFAGAPAHAATEGPDEIFEEEMAQQTTSTGTEVAQLEPSDATRETRVVVRGKDTMVRPEEPERHVTMVQPAAAEAPPLSPDALDALFSGEEGEAAEAVSGVGTADDARASGDSIFDEGDTQASAQDSGPQRGDSHVLGGQEAPMSGESSIFSESPKPGSGVISGIGQGAPASDIVPPDSGKVPPPSKPTMINPKPGPEEEEKA